MERGFWIVLVGVAIIALGYAALSVWPILSETPATQSSVSANRPGSPAPAVQTPRANQPSPNPPGSGTPPPGGNQPASGPGAAPPPAAGVSGGQSPTPAAGPPVNRRQPSSTPPTWPRMASGPFSSPASPEGRSTPDVKYTRESVKLYVEPNGRFHSPHSLNGSPLIIARGSHVLPLEYRDGWVMVRSPGQTLGWLHDDDLTDQPPMGLADEILY